MTSNWDIFKIEDILLIPSRNGLTKPSSLRGKGVKMIAMGELFAHPIIYNIDMDRVPVNDKELKSSNIEVNDLLFARQSLTLEGAGKCSIVKEVHEPTVFESHLIRLRINSKLADPWFVYYYFNSYYGKHSIQNIVNQVAAAGIKGSDLVKLEIPLPSLDIQKKIATQLSEIDDKIAVNKIICENLEAQAQALFKHWFVDFAPFKDGNFCANREQNETCFNSAEVQPKITGKACKFVESELGLIPEGWRVGRLEELCSFISRGLSPKYQLGTNELVLGQTCVRNNVVTLDNAREHQPKVNCNKFVEKWDVLLNSTGIGSLGRVGIIYFNNKNVCFDSHLTVVRTAEEIYRYYVGRNLLNRQKELENMAVGSTGQTELPKKDVLVMPILIPNSDVLPEFNEIIKNIGNTIYILIEENRRLSTLRDTLLPKLMSGQIKVNEIERAYE